MRPTAALAVAVGAELGGRVQLEGHLTAEAAARKRRVPATAAQCPIPTVIPMAMARLTIQPV